MKYNPITNNLYTDKGLLIKKLHCPLSKNWEDLSQLDFLKGKLCDQCQKTVFDTALLDDEQLSSFLKNEPDACLKIDLTQENLTITYTHK